MKGFAVPLFLSGAIASLAIAAAVASAPNLTGTWNIEQTGLNGSSTSQITLKQSGDGVVGTNAANGNGFTGTFVTDGQINGKWHGPGGAGWLTVYVSSNGHSLNGSWGYNGKKETGTFVGNKVLPPSPVTAAGKWHVTAAGGPAAMVGLMACTQSGPTTVCKVGPVVINGKFRTADKVRATWTNGDKSGWFSYWFNDDNNSFNGIWGYGADSTAPVGRVVGQRAL
ncbi:MAG TPA: hypothetical protein VK760_16600 [Candidatus Acidoferrales bacterium]|nr:hypothetical protein [Candidatus Acidoferrales bacterium]